MSNPITVVVVDDDVLVRDGIAAIIDGQPGINVVGSGGDGHDAIDLCTRVSPDVLLLDIQMPGLNGLDALASIRQGSPEVAVIILTTFDTGSYIDRALDAGASGFLLKNSSYEELVSAVRAAHAGHTALSPTVTSHVIDGYLAARTTADPNDLARVASLTARELEILRLLATGASNTDISAALHLSEHTVKTHVSHILTKTSSADRTKAAVLAHRAGLLSDQQS